MKMASRRGSSAKGGLSSSWMPTDLRGRDIGSTSLFSAVSLQEDDNVGRKKRSWLLSLLPKRPLFRVFKTKAANVWGILFGLQCWSLMFLWLFGMVMFMPFKVLFPGLDKNGIMIDAGGRWWSRLVSFPHSVPRMTGYENLPPKNEPCLYIANHASWLDIPILGGYLPPLKFVCKKELTKVPILGRSIIWGQHIIVDRGNMEKRTQVLENCIDRLKRGVSVCLFPEGTRSSLDGGEMLPFQKGAFMIAQQAGVRIVPMSISHTGEIMPTDAIFPLYPSLGYTRIHVHPPIPTKGKDLKELIKECREVIASEIEKPELPLSSFK